MSGEIKPFFSLTFPFVHMYSKGKHLNGHGTPGLAENKGYIIDCLHYILSQSSTRLSNKVKKESIPFDNIAKHSVPWPEGEMGEIGKVKGREGICKIYRFFLHFLFGMQEEEEGRKMEKSQGKYFLTFFLCPGLLTTLCLSQSPGPSNLHEFLPFISLSLIHSVPWIEFKHCTNFCCK